MFKSKKTQTTTHDIAYAVAERTNLPMTVFIHPVYGPDCAPYGSAALRQPRITMVVTWLPRNFFVR